MPQTKDLGITQPRPRRVLIVDDNRDATETLEMLLQLWGYEVRSVHSGLSALEVAPEYRPEVVLLDIGLPGMSGYDVAQRLREVPGFSDVVLVAVTGYGQDNDRSRSREAGFDHHLVKPVEPDKLQALIASVSRSQASA
jgi:CheY-like chemotaxis protein